MAVIQGKTGIDFDLLDFKFWASQNVEHCTEPADFLKRIQLDLRLHAAAFSAWFAALDEFRTQWLLIAGPSFTLDTFWSPGVRIWLIELYARFNGLLKQIQAILFAPVSPTLAKRMSHIIGEVEYQEGSVLFDDMTMREEYIFAATERADALRDINGGLVLLLSMEQLLTPSGATVAMDQNEAMARKFDGFKTSVQSSAPSATGAEWHVGFKALNEQALVVLHSDALTIPTVGLSTNSSLILTGAVNHERKESIWFENYVGRKLAAAVANGKSLG